MGMDKYIIRSPLDPISVFEGPVVAQIWESLERNAKKEALILSSNVTSKITFKQLGQQAETVAKNLKLMGLGPGQVLTIYCSNCLEYAVIVLATWKVGAIVALLNPMAIASDVKRELHRLKSEFLFTNKANVSNAIKGASGSNLRYLITLEGHTGCTPYSDLLRNNTFELPPVNYTSQDDTVAILFSSGTTGLPKAVQLTHRNINTEVAYAQHPEMAWNWESMVIFSPLVTVYGLATLTRALVKGSRTVIMPKFDLEKYIQLVEKYKVTDLRSTPPVAVRLVKSGLLQKYDMSSVMDITNAGARLAPEIGVQLQKQLGEHLLLREGYGLTESTGLIVGTPGRPGMHKYNPMYQNSLGLLMPGNEAKVVDPETGKSLPREARGELCFRGPVVMKGYLGNVEATKSTIDPDGWLHSGDIGFVDENGCFYAVDRLKELIKYNAFQVSPTELESILLEHPAVADAAVVGKPDPMGAGELPLAWVVTKPNTSNVSENDIAQYVAEKVAAYKKLRGGVYFVDAIPKSPSGKIQRRDIVVAVVKNAMKSKL